MKKKKWIIGISLVLLLVIIIGIAGPAGYIFKRLYYDLPSPEKVKVNLTVTQDGQALPIDKESIKVVLDNDHPYAAVIRAEGNTASIGYDACYGVFEVQLNAGEIPICFEHSHFNEWDHQTYVMNIDIDTKKQTATYHCDYTYLNEDTMTVKETETKSVPMDNGRVDISIYAN